MKELGNYLKTARIKNGVSLTEVSEDLDLSTALLENIESGNVRAFKDVYELKEYIKRYAKYLVNVFNILFLGLELFDCMYLNTCLKIVSSGFSI